MQFKYLKKSIWFSWLLLIIGLVLFIYWVYNWVFSVAFLFFSLGLIYVGYEGLRNSRLHRNATLIINDDRISYQKNSYVTSILWPEVKKVDTNIIFNGIIGTGFVAIFSGLLAQGIFTITIESETVNIEITSDMENLPLIISKIKENTGELFDSSKIPLKYKLVTHF